MAGVRRYRERVERALPAFFDPVEVVASLPTTMRRAAELAAAGAPEGATVVADEQTAGRGRLDRSWEAPAGSSLLVSVVLRPRIDPAAAWAVAALAGVALADAAATLAGPGVDATLKWPNDLLLGGRKAAGLLAEGHLAGGRLDWVVLGMGVNVTQTERDFPAGLRGRATSLSLAAGHPVDRVELLAAWGERFARGWPPLGSGSIGQVLDAYRERLGTLGRAVRVERVGAEPLEGRAVGLAPSGALVISSATGERLTVAAADVEHLHGA